MGNRTCWVRARWGARRASSKSERGGFARRAAHWCARPFDRTLPIERSQHARGSTRCRSPVAIAPWPMFQQLPRAPRRARRTANARAKERWGGRRRTGASGRGSRASPMGLPGANARCRRARGLYGSRGARSFRVNVPVVSEAEACTPACSPPGQRTRWRWTRILDCGVRAKDGHPQEKARGESSRGGPG